MNTDRSSTPPAPFDAAEGLKARLRADLLAAMRAKATVEVAVLRALVAALDNAQAVPLAPGHQRYVEYRFGDRSAEVPRLAVSGVEVADLLDRERRDRLAAAAEFAALGQSERAARLSAEADIVARYLAD